jgi:TRAP-type transport system small permease protein
VKFLERATLGLSWLGVVAVVGMMAVVVGDVLMRTVFHRPIPGAFDFVESALVAAVFLSLPRCFLRDQNIVVDLLDSLLGPKVVAGLKVLAAVVALSFLTALLWNMISPARDALQFGDRKPDLPIPIFGLWILIFVGCFVSLVALGAVAWRCILGLVSRL